MRILVVDDEELQRHSLRSILTKKGYEVEVASSGEAALELLKNSLFHAALVDLKMPKMDGIQLLREIKELDEDAIVIMITGYATVETAVKAMRQGAYDYIPKPFEADEIDIIIRRAVTQQQLLKKENYLRQIEAQKGMSQIVGETDEIQRVRELIQQAAPTDITTLIQGETGTGKELVAKAIHNLSTRSDGLFVPVNCGAIPDNLMESELFGHVKGAFTNASNDKKGLFEMADSGSLFLDEIGELPLPMQVKLLRALEQHEIRKIGSPRSIKVDVRVVASTNRNLRMALEEGLFREDLFYRLNVFPIVIPPLRQHKQDIPLLVEHFLRVYSQQLKKLVAEISQEALDILMDYDWPGNVRELENTIERAVLIERSKVISPSSLYIGSTKKVDFFTMPFKEAKDAFEREYLINVLKNSDGNITRVAKQMGVHRTTLYDLTRKHQIDIIKSALAD